MNQQTQMMGQDVNSNPFMIQAKKMAEGKSPEELAALLNNVCGSLGISKNEAINIFNQMKGMK